jgi:hypothetical protein
MENTTTVWRLLHRKQLTRMNFQCGFYSHDETVDFDNIWLTQIKLSKKPIDQCHVTISFLLIPCLKLQCVLNDVFFCVVSSVLVKQKPTDCVNKVKPNYAIKLNTEIVCKQTSTGTIQRCRWMSFQMLIEKSIKN